MLDSDADISTGMTQVFFVSPLDTIKGVNAGVRLGALPVELLTFSGRYDRKTDSNKLRWSTASEINNERFEVFRAINSQSQFTSIGEVEGNGTTLETSHYTFEDVDISSNGTYYYRLKQIDFDGGYDYSAIIAIEVNRPKSKEVNLYPNPTKGVVTLNLAQHHSNLERIELISIDGQKTRTWNATLAKANGDESQLRLNIQGMAAGLYIMKISTPREVILKKLQITP